MGNRLKTAQAMKKKLSELLFTVVHLMFV